MLQVIVRRGRNRAEQKSAIQRHQFLLCFVETQEEWSYQQWLCIKQSFYRMGGFVVALMVWFTIVLILGGLTDKHWGGSSRNYLFQIWMVMALLQLLLITLGNILVKKLSSYAAKKHTLYNTGTEFNSYLPTLRPACIWPHEKKLEESSEWMEEIKSFKRYTFQAAFSTAFETPFEWHKTCKFDQWILGNRNITT